MLPFILLAIGIAARLITHEPNFTPTIALVLFGGVYLNKRYAVLLPVMLMMLTDLFLGAHNTILFTWGSLIAIAFIGLAMRNRKNAATIAGSSMLAAVVFFIVSNFGVWAVGWYPYTLEGFISCYVAAIPFFRSTVASTLFYSCVFFGLYEIIAYRVRDTRLARVLLTT